MEYEYTAINGDRSSSIHLSDTFINHETCALILADSQRHKHTHSLSLSLSHSLTHSHTHTHTHTEREREVRGLSIFHDVYCSNKHSIITNMVLGYHALQKHFHHGIVQGSATFNVKRAILAPFPPNKIHVEPQNI